MTVVVVTRNRRERLLEGLPHLLAERAAEVIVVDNASDDGSAEAVRSRFPAVRWVGLPVNVGAAARNRGVELARTPYVAFSDDDSWWRPGALGAAAELLDSHADVGLVAARILVGDGEREDRTCATMASSALGTRKDLPGPSVMGFVACGAVVRREAFRASGGFHPRYGTGGEERLLALDLAAAGWQLVYAPNVVAHHHPTPGPRPGRDVHALRNDLWSAWLRRRRPALASARLLTASNCSRGDRARALGLALGGAGWVVRERRPVARHVERAARAVERDPRPD